jgi:hypothetical protein
VGVAARKTSHCEVFAAAATEWWRQKHFLVFRHIDQTVRILRIVSITLPSHRRHVKALYIRVLSPHMVSTIWQIHIIMKFERHDGQPPVLAESLGGPQPQVPAHSPQPPECPQGKVHQNELPNWPEHLAEPAR